MRWLNQLFGRHRRHDDLSVSIQDPQIVMRIQNDILDKLQTISGVTSVGFAASVPMEGIEPNWDEIRIEGKNYENEPPPLRLFNFVSPGYFHTAGTRMIAGRDFTWTDVYGLRPLIIVSENFARESWGTPSAAIGKRVRQFVKMPWQEVIGVVQDVRHNGVDEKAPALVYWTAMLDNPYTQPKSIDVSRSVTFAIRSNRAGNETFLNEVQQAVWSVNASLPVASVRTMDEIYGRSLARTSFTLVMLAIAGTMALILGIIGIYGVISYAVSQRTREIGIRLALGAQKSKLRWLFVRSGLALTGAGVAVGLVVAAGLMQFMKSMLFGVSPLDPLTYIVIAVDSGRCAGACQLYSRPSRCGRRSSGGSAGRVTLPSAVPRTSNEHDRGCPRAEVPTDRVCPWVEISWFWRPGKARTPQLGPCVCAAKPA